MALSGAEVESWSLTQEIAGSNIFFFAKMLYKFYEFYVKLDCMEQPKMPS